MEKYSGDSSGKPGDSTSSRADSVKGDNRSNGKNKETPFSDRIQDSGRMVLNSILSAQPTTTGLINNEKASSPAGSRGSVGQCSASNSSFAETSTARKPREHGTSMRATGSNSGHVSTQYEQFVNASPKLQDQPQIDHHTGPLTESQPSWKSEVEDGKDVLQLLSMPDEEPNYEEVGDALSDDEAARLREAFFSSRNPGSSWDQLLDFKPDFVLSPRKSDEASLHMGVADAAAAYDTWLQQWHEVLVSYTDEVWGDLGSLAREARQDVEKVEESGTRENTAGPELKALERLRQILSHVRGGIRNTSAN